MSPRQISPVRVLCVFGTRPEAIKMAPIILAMRKQTDRFSPIVCVTGQHREMLDQVLATFEIEPDVDLSVMTPKQTLARLTARILERVEETLMGTQPDVLLVQGDTTTAFAGALAAFYRNVPIGHVEAGLRTGDLTNPFPEEANRVFIDRMARYCFAPTEQNGETLLDEGVPPERIFVTGNTGIDALLITRAKVAVAEPDEWAGLWGSAANAVQNNGKPIVLITLHRRESFGDKLRTIFEMLRSVAKDHPKVEFVYPVHLNPNVINPAQAILGSDNVHLIDPLPYEAFVYLMDRAALILTDSGGIQEEAPSLGKRVIVLRDTSERQEAIQAGLVTLGGTDCEHLARLINDFLAAGTPHFANTPNPYGDGTAATQILDKLWKTFERDSPL